MSLSLVIGSGNSLVGAVALHGVLSASQLVGQHTADGLVQDAAGGPGWWKGQESCMNDIVGLDYFALCPKLSGSTCGGKVPASG